MLREWTKYILANIESGRAWYETPALRKTREKNENTVLRRALDIIDKQNRRQVTAAANK